MKYLTTICSLALLTATSLYASCPSCYVDYAIPPNTLRHDTFVRAIQLMEERNAKIIVETGTSRNGKRNCLGDGCSTVIFSKWAHDNHATLYSIDIDANALHEASLASEPYTDCVNFIQSDSLPYLNHFNEQIDFLYLDSYDFDSRNPYPSQNHHLQEIINAYPWLTEKSVVMIDDCELQYGGKGKLIINFLLSKGWKIDKKGYQVIMVKQ